MAALGRLRHCTCPKGTPPGEYSNDCKACVAFHDYLQALGLPPRPPQPTQSGRRCRASLSMLTHCALRAGHDGPHSTEERTGHTTWTSPDVT